MSHISERDFIEGYAIPWLKEQHPNATIERNRYIEDPRGFADLWVHIGSHILAVEVGNNDASIREEAAQAIEYAADQPNARPMVIVPDGHGERTSIRIWRNHCLIRLLPTPE